MVARTSASCLKLVSMDFLDPANRCCGSNTFVDFVEKNNGNDVMLQDDVC